MIKTKHPYSSQSNIIVNGTLLKIEKCLLNYSTHIHTQTDNEFILYNITTRLFLAHLLTIWEVDIL